MCCPGCAKNVERAVGDMRGVETVTADHGDGELDVVFDDESVAVDDIVDEAERAGCGMG